MNRFVAATFFLSAIATGCTKSATDSRVTLQLPAKRFSSLATPLQKDSTATRWGFAVPSSPGETDCYAIFIQAHDLSQIQCKTLDGSNVTTVSQLYGQYAAGSAISIDMKPGKNRTIGVWAFRSASGSCSDSAKISPSRYSAPLFVGATSMDIATGDNKAEINATFANAKQIEQCAGGDLGVWPPVEDCAPKITEMKLLGANQIQISGSCLDQAMGVTLKENSTSTETVMTIAARTANKITASVATNLVMKAGQVYSVILPTAKADATVTAQLTLLLDPVLTLKSGSTIIGTILGDYTGYGLLLRTPSGELARYITPGGSTDGSLVFNGFLGVIPQPFANLSQTLIDRKLSTWEVGTSFTYYTGSNCTGDIVAMGGQSMPGTFVGKYFSYVKCPTVATCTSALGKLTSTPTLTSGIAVLSAASQSGPGTYNCNSAPNTFNGYNLGTPGTYDGIAPTTIPAGWTLSE